MNIKQLNEEFSKFTETQIEGDLTPQAQVQAIFDGDDEDTYLAEVIVPNLDEFTDAELLGIFNKISETGDGDYSIYPSQWDSEAYGEYPAKLALALSKSNDAENLSEIYNMYYAGHDLSDEAADIFRKACKKNPEETYSQFAVMDDEEIMVDFLNELGDEEPMITKLLLKLTKQHNPERAKALRAALRDASGDWE